MPLQIVRNDITKMNVDAIVNAANSSLLGGGGVDGCIHRAAGPNLLEECRGLGGCETGKAKITNAYDLPCKYVIHTVGPVWHGGDYSEKELLKSCYYEFLNIALQNNCESIAFPLISAGAYGYPKDEALNVATEAISSFILEHELDAYLVIYDEKSFSISEKLFGDIECYIDKNYVDKHTDYCLERTRATRNSNDNNFLGFLVTNRFDLTEDKKASYQTISLDHELENLDESFSEMLLRKIDEKGISDADCYKKANIDKRLFSRIRSNKSYKPSKPTVLAFCISLELSLEETNEMLMKAGYALSHSNKFDVIVEYFIKKKQYNIFEINDALFAFDQKLLGA